MTFFTHPEPYLLRELQTDWVLPPKCYGTPYFFWAKTKVTGAPRAPTDHRHSNKVEQCVWRGWTFPRATASSWGCSTFSRREEEGERQQYLHRAGRIKCRGVYPGTEANRGGYPCYVSEDSPNTLYQSSTTCTVPLSYTGNPQEFSIHHGTIHHTYYPWFTPDLLRYDCTMSVLYPAPSSHSQWIRSKV